MECYFDNAATTIPHRQVADYLYEAMLKNYANPSSLHKKALEAKKIIDYATYQMLQVLNLTGRKAIYTSGATESANLAIKGTLEKYDDLSKNHIITTRIEHPCVSEVFEYYESKGVSVSYVPVDQFGQIDGDSLLSAIRPNTRLISLIWVNNEFGAVQPLSNLISKIRAVSSGILIHIDAVQGYGKIWDDLSDADMISISAHKFHGPKGIGALIIKKNITLFPQMLGGGQQENFRSGTINAPMIGAMGKACEMISFDVIEHIKRLQTYLFQNLCNKYGEELFNTKPLMGNYAPHILNISFPGLKGEVILHMLEEDGIYLSTASACSSHKQNKNSVLKQIGRTAKDIDGTIRISLSEYNTKEEIDYFIEKLSVITEKLSRFKKG